MLALRLRRLTGLALTLAGLSGCLTPLPDQRWIVVESENFRLYSQISQDETVALAKKLETFREVTRRFTNAGAGAFKPVIPTVTYVFSSGRAYRGFAPARSAGFMAPRERANYIALNGRQSGLDATRIIYHEFVHFLLRSGGSSSYPRWYDEGMAEYLGATVIDDDNVTLAAVPDDRLPTFQVAPLLSMKRLLTAGDTRDWSRIDEAMLYAQSWLLVHYLNHGAAVGMADRSAELREYIRLLGEGNSTDQAFTQAFHTTFEGLGKEVGDYLKGNKVQKVTIARTAFPAPEIRTVRAATKLEIALQLGDLALAVGDAKRARALFEAALAVEPENPRALAGLASAGWRQGRPYDEVRRSLERAVALGPNDALNHLDLAEYLLAVAAANTGSPEHVELLKDARDAFARAIELAPELPEAYARAAGVYRLPDQDWRKGVPLIERAHELLPSDVTITASLAEFCILGGEYDRAKALLDSAAQGAAEGGAEGARAIEELRSRLKEARGQTVAAPAAVSSGAETETEPREPSPGAP